MNTIETPLLGFAAWSGTGKTTLLKQLLPRLIKRGVRVGCIKHAHHEFDVDTPGKDSYELRHAGASQVLIASEKRWALMTENRPAESPDLWQLIAQLDHQQLDLILVEGFKAERFPKIELYRASVGKPLQFIHDDSIVAIATDSPEVLPQPSPITLLDLNNIEMMERFIYQFSQSQGVQG